MQHLNKVQNRFLSFASYRLNIAHPPHGYSLIGDIFSFKSLSERRNISSCRFINRLIERTIDAPRLLERLVIHVPGCTRFKGLLNIPVNRTNFVKNSPLVNMISIVNNNVVFFTSFTNSFLYLGQFLYLML